MKALLLLPLWLLSAGALLTVEMAAQSNPMISGLYENRGLTLVARRDMPTGNVTLSSLFLTNVADQEIESVLITQNESSLRLLFLNAAGATIAVETIKDPTVAQERLTFSRTSKSTNEAGRVAVTVTYNISLDHDRALVIENLLRYTVKYLLFFKNKGEDRAVYSFKRLGDALPKPAQNEPTRQS